MVSAKMIVSDNNNLQHQSHTQYQLKKLVKREYFMYLFEYHFLTVSLKPV
jgi:hypothetical protein